MMRVSLAVILVFAMQFLGSSGPMGQPTSDPRVADIVQSGKLRVGLGVVAPHWAVKDPATGELRGVAVDLGRALAARVGVAFVAVEYPSPPAILGGLKDDAWDVGFLGVDPSRTGLVDFSPAYLQIDATYLVAPGSSVRTVPEADRSGMRIAVTANSVEHTVLSKLIRQADLRGVATIPAGFELLRSGEVSVLAAPRPTLVLLARRLLGSRVLDDKFNTTFGAAAVPKGKAGRLAYVSEFVQQVRSSGLVQQAIERAGVSGVQVAPPDAK